VGFNYFSSTITGSFTWADCDASYSGLYVNGTSLSVYSAEFTVTEVEGGYQVEAYVLCTDNHCYHVMMFYSAEGINTANQVQVKVYPNPAADMLHVEADGIVRIDVIDAAGRIVLSNTRNVNTLNISGLSNGVYQLSVKHGRIACDPAMLVFCRFEINSLQMTHTTIRRSIFPWISR